MLGGTYQPYEQSISDTIENAFQHGNSEVLIQLRGTRYLIALKPANGFKQKLESDPTKVRTVQRTGPPRAGTTLAPAAAAPAPAAAAPAKRKAADKDGAPAAKAAKANTADKQSPPPVAKATADAGPPSSSASDAPPGDSRAPSGLMSEGSNNERIHKMLIDLADSEKIKGDSVRSGTYYKAAHAVKTHTAKITSGKEAEKIKGVGKKISAKIDELLTTGKLDRLEREKSDPHAASLKELQRVSGIGPVFAEELYSKHGVKDLAMLSMNSGALLSREAQIGLKHLKDFESRIPREEVERLEAVVRAAAEAHDPPLQMRVCGSYRRGKADSGDIDCLLCHPSYHEREAQVPGWLSTLVDALTRSGFITDTIAEGRKKCAAVCRLADDEPCAQGGESSAAGAATAAGVGGGGGSGDDGSDGSADGGAGGSNGGGSAAPSLPDQALAAPAALAGQIRLPSMKELQAKRAATLAAKKNTDTFASWKAAGKQPSGPAGASSGEANNGGGGGDGGGGGGGGNVSGSGGGSSNGDASKPALPGSGGGAQDVTPPRRFRRLDLRLVPYECYHASTLYFTGSDEHNKLMRNVAIKKGLELSEYGLFKKDADGKTAARPEVVHSEEDIFKLLDMAYATPVERDI